MRRTICFFVITILGIAAALSLISCRGKVPDPPVIDVTAVPVSPAHAAATEEPAETAAPTAEPTPAPTAEAGPTPRPRPEEVTLEWLAAELLYRWSLGYVDLELADYSDIMDRNKDTDMFFYANQIEIDAVKLGVFQGIRGVGPGTAQIDWVVDESENEITVHVAASPEIAWDDPMTVGGGTDFQITVDKQRMVITAYDQFICEGTYTNRIKPLSLQYRADHPWEEADRMAYDEVYAWFEKEAGH